MAFYRDGIGLTEIGGFRGHGGYDGVFLAVPGTRAHLELTTGGEHGAPVPHPESLLVLYLGDPAAVEGTLQRVGVEPVASANPYWAGHGVTILDPDGFRVVLVPESWPSAVGVRVEPYVAARADLRSLFELAEDSPLQLDGYIEAGRVLVAVHEDEIVGHVQVTETSEPAQLEVKNMAVATHYQGHGVGRALLAATITLAREERRSQLVVATAATDTGNLAFYQRLGFRMRSVERDAFTSEAGYEIEVRDRVWLDLALDAPA